MLKETSIPTTAAAPGQIKPRRNRRTRRKWCYAHWPSAYGIAPHSCGCADIQWSEWKKHCWCPVCKVDFIPEDNGVFDGPIPLGLANMLGIRFDRYDLKTLAIIRQEDYMREPAE